MLRWSDRFVVMVMLVVVVMVLVANMTVTAFVMLRSRRGFAGRAVMLVVSGGASIAVVGVRVHRERN